MNRNIFRRSVLSALLVCGFATSTAHAAYPERPVTVVVSFAPGGMTDTVTRWLTTELSKKFDQTFVVENRPGAAGQVGTEYVARQKNDGYTLLVSATGHAIGPAVNPKVKFDPVNDFEAIGILARTPNLIVVNPEVPAKTIPEFLDWAKKQTAIPYSTAGFGGSTHLGGEWFKLITGIPMEHIPYKGAAPGTQAVMAGEVQVGVQDASSVASFLESGHLRAIGLASATPSKQFPDLKTFAESGVPGLDVYTWLGFYAPAGTDPEIVEKLNQATNEIMNSPEMVARLSQSNSDALGPMTPAQAREFVQNEVTKWRKVVEDANIQVE